MAHLHKLLMVSAVARPMEATYYGERIRRTRQTALQQLETYESVVADFAEAARYSPTTPLGVNLAELSREQIRELLEFAEAACRTSRVTYVLAFGLDDDELHEAFDKPHQVATAITEALAEAMADKPSYVDAQATVAKYGASMRRRTKQLEDTASVIALLTSSLDDDNG